MLEADRDTQGYAHQHHFLQHEGGERPREEQWPHHQTQNKVFLENIVQVRLQEVAVLHPVENRPCEQECKTKDHDHVEETFEAGSIEFRVRVDLVQHAGTFGVELLGLARWGQAGVAPGAGHWLGLRCRFILQAHREQGPSFGYYKQLKGLVYVQLNKGYCENNGNRLKNIITRGPIILTLSQQNKQNLTYRLDMLNHNFDSPPRSRTASHYKQLQGTSTSIPAEDCPYCEMKRRFNIGSPEGQKCLEHSLKASIEGLGHESQSESGSGCGSMSAQEMLGVLGEVEHTLDYYWDNLKQVSGGRPEQIQKDLEPVLGCVKRVQDKLGKFFFDSSIQIPVVKPQMSPVHPKKHNTGSERFNRAELSNFFDLEENETGQSIKEWVMHFHKLLQLRQVPEADELLPCEQQLEMRIFKQSMERKFLAFAEEINKYEKKVKDVLTKLIYYMEKSSETVPEKQIQEDIKFIEGTAVEGETRQTQMQRMLLLQASSMEHLLLSGS